MNPGGAERFLALHHGPGVLVLPNAWDVARLFEDIGFDAVATTSGGVAASRGFSDGEHISIDDMLDIVQRIASAVAIPVTADMEAGFGLDPSVLARRVADTGAVGLNFEDRAGDADQHAEKVAAVKAAEPALVVNARVDVFVRQWGEEGARAAEAVRRGRLYLEAGADCVYPIGLIDEATIAELVVAIPGPVNVMATPSLPSIARLAEMGVRRVSIASSGLRASLGALDRAARQLREEGTYSALFDGAVRVPRLKEGPASAPSSPASPR